MKEFHNGNNSVYYMGKYDRNQHEFYYENVYSLDDGLDFYAPQTMLASDGRRIMIGWMQSWDSNIRPVGQKWSCMMTLPRELRIENGKILQSPVREIEKYHRNPVCYENVLRKISAIILGLRFLRKKMQLKSTGHIPAWLGMRWLVER